MAPTQSNLKKLQQPMFRPHMPGSIVDSILDGVGTRKAPRSQAMSTGSMFSQMRAGSFFKMMDSPLKLTMMNAMEKQMTGGTVVGVP